MFAHDIGGGAHLRLLEERHVEELYALSDANRAYLTPWMPWARDGTIDGTREFIRAGLQQVVRNDGFHAGIFVNGAIAGTIGFHRIVWLNRDTSMGYWLAENMQGRGRVTRATIAMVDHAFEQWKLNRVEIKAAPENRRSRAIPERLGFTQEGVLREASLVNERYQDLVLYAMLAKGWPAARAAAARFARS